MYMDISVKLVLSDTSTLWGPYVLQAPRTVSYIQRVVFNMWDAVSTSISVPHVQFLSMLVPL